MELSDTDKNTLKEAVQLMWRKGTHTPQEAAIAFTFTQFVEKVCGFLPAKPASMIENAPKKSEKVIPAKTQKG
jgi:hypothetical protein